MDRFGKYDSEPELSRFHNYPLRKKLPERAVWTDSLKKKIPESFSDQSGEAAGRNLKLR